MTTPAELEAKITRLPIDLDLLHDFVKGDDTTDVVGEEGTYPSLAKFLANLEILASANQIVFCDAVGTTTKWTISPRTGYSIEADAAEQILVFKAPARQVGTQVLVEATGITGGDAFPTVAPNMTTIVNPASIAPGAFVALRWRSGAETIQPAKFECLLPAISSVEAATVGPFVWMTYASRTNNYVTLNKAGGILPNNTGSGYIFAWMVPAGFTVASGEWRFSIDGITLDPLTLLRRDGIEVRDDEIKAGDVVFFTRPAGQYVLLDLWSAESASGGGSTPDTLNEILINARGAAARAANAERVSRKLAKQIGQWRDWTPVATPGSGTGMTYDVISARYIEDNGTIHANFRIHITAAGTGAGALNVTLPFAAKNAAAGAGRENGVTGSMLQANVNAGVADLVVRQFNGLTGIANSAQFIVSITYEKA